MLEQDPRAYRPFFARSEDAVKGREQGGLSPDVAQDSCRDPVSAAVAAAAAAPAALAPTSGEWKKVQIAIAESSTLIPHQAENAMTSIKSTADPAPTTAQVGVSMQEAIQAQFDTGIWYAISLWPALNIAVANNWGGPTSADKRDWFAGAISDLFAQQPNTDNLDVEVMLLQVMQDEFDVNVEDETEVPVAAEIMTLRKQTLEGDFAGVLDAQERFQRRGGKVERVNVVENTVEGDEDELDDEDEEGDVEMGEAPQLAPARERAEPEVDDEGFTKVVSKKKR